MPEPSPQRKPADSSAGSARGAKAVARPAPPKSPYAVNANSLELIQSRRTWQAWFRENIVDGATGTFVSLALHLAILGLLGLIVYQTSEGLEATNGIIASWMTAEELAEEEAAAARIQKPVEIAATKITDPEMVRPEGEKPITKPAAQETPEEKTSFTGPPAKVDRALTGRTEKQRNQLLKLFGGTKQSENAVGMGLGWLSRHQLSDGRWELHRGYDHPGRESLRTDTGATALSLLCFLGAGYTDREGKYKDVVKKGLTWLKKIQKADGDLHDWNELGRQTAFYAHGQGTIALCEAYALTHDESLLPTINKALQFILKSQNEQGGWQYQPGAVGDLSVTGWQLMALQSAKMAGLEVPDEAFIKINMFLDSVSTQGGARYRYKAVDPESRFSPAMTAEGLLCRQYLGWSKDHPAMKDGVEWLLSEENLPSWSDGRRNVYYWYYATQVMHHIEGEPWDRWNGALRDQITKSQLKSGKLSGSWHPHQPHGNDHEYGEAGGRLYITSMSILTLEVYYRHLPLYREVPLPTEPTDEMQ